MRTRDWLVFGFLLWLLSRGRSDVTIAPTDRPPADPQPGETWTDAAGVVWSFDPQQGWQQIAFSGRPPIIETLV